MIPPSVGKPNPKPRKPKLNFLLSPTEGTAGMALDPPGATAFPRTVSNSIPGL